MLTLGLNITGMLNFWKCEIKMIIGSLTLNLCVNQHDVSCHSTHVLKQIVHWKFSNPQQSLCSLYQPKASQHFNQRKAISKPEDIGTVNYNPTVRDTSWDKHVKAWVITWDLFKFLNDSLILSLSSLSPMKATTIRCFENLAKSKNKANSYWKKSYL